MVMTGGRLSRYVVMGCCTLAMIAAVVLAGGAQVAVSTGENIAPVYEGWEKNPDGSFNLVFGYFNRNWVEEIDLPVGPNNNIEPGAPDQGQPTHFLPRRNRFLFRIRVPQDFGEKELVWTLASHGKTERAYATLKPDYFMDNDVIQNNTGASGGTGGRPDTLGNKAPTLTVEGGKTRNATVGQPVVLTAVATDDGMPTPRPLKLPEGRIFGNGRGTPGSATGLRLTWFVYRGAGKVRFDPPQITAWEDYREGRNSPWSTGWSTPPVPPEGKWTVRATFSEPGTYVLRALAHDGGLGTPEDITFVVK
jgi:hypothetical protein